MIGILTECHSIFARFQLQEHSWMGFLFQTTTMLYSEAKTNISLVLCASLLYLNWFITIV